METDIIHVKNLNDLPKAAKAVIDQFSKSNIVAFYGHMGAGKTTLIREIASLMGVEDNVTSPTFALVNQYRDRDQRTINHFDFYRIENIREAYDMGYEEYFFSDELCLIEWPEKIEELMPLNHVKVRIEVLDDGSRNVLID